MARIRALHPHGDFSDLLETIQLFAWAEVMLKDTLTFYTFCPDIPYQICFWTSIIFTRTGHWFNHNNNDRNKLLSISMTKYFTPTKFEKHNFCTKLIRARMTIWPAAQAEQTLSDNSQYLPKTLNNLNLHRCFSTFPGKLHWIDWTLAKSPRLNEDIGMTLGRGEKKSPLLWLWRFARQWIALDFGDLPKSVCSGV